MARRIHIVPVEDESNGVWRVANMLAAEDGGTVQLGCGGLDDAEEVWVHGMWLPREWRACWRALRLGKRLVRMTHGSLSPAYLRYHGWKKWLVGPIERYFLRRSDRIVATCAAEKGWIEAYLGKRCPPIEVTDIKRFFDLSRVEGGGGNGRVERVDGMGMDSRVERVEGERKLHLLYLGRRHPLKGLEYLEEAVKSLEFRVQSSECRVPGSVFWVGGRECVFRMESNVFGEEKERVWAWCDVLVLPTLSENFGLVVAEALERGKRVITTDGAPAWGGNLSRVERVETCRGGEILSGYGGRLIYLKGYRDGSAEERVRLLKEAIESLSV